jgi:hypothetical protein
MDPEFFTEKVNRGLSEIFEMEGDFENALKHNLVLIEYFKKEYNPDKLKEVYIKAAKCYIKI